MPSTFAALLLVLAASTVEAIKNQHTTTKSADCSCGFVDPTSTMRYTESLIVYFNETDAIESNGLRILHYEHLKEKGWNTLYKQGSSSLNVDIDNDGSLSWQNAIDGNSSSLQLWCDPPTSKHLVVGAEVRSLRQDILQGTFRASLRSSHPWAGGSALTMALAYNSSDSTTMDMLNQDNASDAYVTNLVNGERPTYSLGTNYTVLAKGSDELPPLQPWDFVDLRFDWWNETVDFWVGTNLTRHITAKDRTLPKAPKSLQLRHWSTGDTDYTMGPPVNRSVANIRYLRAFFNSSSMTAAAHHEYDNRCSKIEACSVDDLSLRGSTSFGPAALVPWQEPAKHQQIRWVAGVVAGVFSSFGVASLFNAFIRRTPWHKLKKLGFYIDRKEELIGSSARSPYENPFSVESGAIELKDTRQSAKDSPLSSSGPPTPPPEAESAAASSTNLADSKSYGDLEASVPVPSHPNNYESPVRSRGSHVRMTSGEAVSSLGYFKEVGCSDTGDKSRRLSRVEERVGGTDGEDAGTPGSASDLESQGRATTVSPDEIASDEKPVRKQSDRQTSLEKRREFEEGQSGTTPTVPSDPKGTSAGASGTESTQPGSETGVEATVASAGVHETKALNAPQQRIDYLAGLVAITCIFVTFRHFCLTFWPYVANGYGDNMHFAIDKQVAYVSAAYLITPMWIGPFFVTSCRFLAARYLKQGKISDIANKVLLRGARMLVPCYIFMLLEYFLISLDLTAFLEYLPSITWTTWPYVKPQPNFGVWLNEAVELTYLIPNASPEVVNHYCVGVLWTIPVQHYYSYVTLLAAVMIRDIKRPWKRLTFYALAIIAGWYAVSWSACHWAGLLIADLDITYNWLAWIKARRWAHYSILTLCGVLSLATPLMLLFNSTVVFFPIMGYEAAIHPDLVTGLPILSTPDGDPATAYPDYFQPYLAVLIFSVALQLLVELSSVAQWLLSIKVITMLHPHIMTIYLMHGFVFWTLGAWLAVVLTDQEVPYWALLLIVALICYTVIFTVSSLLTPLIEFATQATMKNIWRWATEDPVPHRQTTAPFTKALILGRFESP